jgi:hypothetical protein
LVAGELYARLDAMRVTVSPFARKLARAEAPKAALRDRLGNAPYHVAKCMREHIAIAEAVAARKPAEVNRILIGHIARKEGSYREQFGRRFGRAWAAKTSGSADHGAVEAIWPLIHRAARRIVAPLLANGRKRECGIGQRFASGC